MGFDPSMLRISEAESLAPRAPHHVPSSSRFGNAPHCTEFTVIRMRDRRLRVAINRDKDQHLGAMTIYGSKDMLALKEMAATIRLDPKDVSAYDSIASGIEPHALES